jgi:hypothetical protein
LGYRRFTVKTPDFGYWISLDFLGFSRPDRDLSMGYEDTSEKVFSAAFVVAKEPSKRLVAADSNKKFWLILLTLRLRALVAKRFHRYPSSSCLRPKVAGNSGRHNNIAVGSD